MDKSIFVPKNDDNYSYLIRIDYIDTDDAYFINNELSKIQFNKQAKILIIGSHIENIKSYFSSIKITYDHICCTNNIQNLNTNLKNILLVRYIGEYNYIFIYNCVLYIKDKDDILTTLYRYLGLNGKIAFVEHFLGIGSDLHDDFLTYIKDKNYHLYNIYSYAGLLDECKFINIKIKDNISYIINKLDNEIELLEENSQKFIDEYNEIKYNNILSIWQKKKIWYTDRCMSWGFITAEK